MLRVAAALCLSVAACGSAADGAPARAWHVPVRFAPPADESQLRDAVVVMCALDWAASRLNTLHAERTVRAYTFTLRDARRGGAAAPQPLPSVRVDGPTRTPTATPTTVTRRPPGPGGEQTQHTSRLDSCTHVS